MMISGGEPFMPDALENLCNVPIRMVNGRLDPQKNAFAGNVPDLDALALHKLEYDFRYWQLLRRGHEVIPELTNGVFLEVLDQPRDPNPARVVFSVEPFLDASEPRPGSSSATTPRTGSRVSPCAATTSSAATREPSTRRRSRAPTACGCRIRTRSSAATPNSRATSSGRIRRRTGFDEWVEQGISFTPGPPQPVENGFTRRLHTGRDRHLRSRPHGPRSDTGAHRHRDRRRPHRAAPGRGVAAAPRWR